MPSLTGVVHQIASLLTQKHWYLATAESCTGGLIAATLTEIPGSSLWFERGFVTYSNLSKQELLDVPEELIKTYGAVSEEVAQAMALGALKHSGAQLAVSVTGIAGPDGGSQEKPVGTVCFSWAARHNTPITVTKHYSGTRGEIRLAACREALNGICTLVDGL